MASISRWIVETIKLAYAVQITDLPDSNPTAHEVRALSSSLAWSNSIPLERILKACYWNSDNSFVRFYLRDCSLFNNELASLGPLVAAQSVIGVLLPEQSDD